MSQYTARKKKNSAVTRKFVSLFTSTDLDDPGIKTEVGANNGHVGIMGMAWCLKHFDVTQDQINQISVLL